MNRPALLLPIGVLLLLTTLLCVGAVVDAFRWSRVVADQRWCTGDVAPDATCADRVSARAEGPFRNRRQPGNTWRVTLNPALGERFPQSVDVPHDGPLKDRGGGPVAAYVEHESHDVVALEVDGEVLRAEGAGAHGIVLFSGFALAAATAGTGLVLVAVRMRRDTRSWWQRRTIQRYGSAWLALPVLLTALLLGVSWIV